MIRVPVRGTVRVARRAEHSVYRRNSGNSIAAPASCYSSMRGYRAFFYDGADRITRAHEFEAADDQEAVKIAEAWREGRKMDLWDRARRVRCWGFGACSQPDCPD